MSIFKIGDKIFSIHEGWGFIKSVSTNFCIDIDFTGTHRTYDEQYAKQWLSFTYYDLIKGGFSHERPKPEIEKGTVIYVKAKGHEPWMVAYFCFMDGEKVAVSHSKLDSAVPRYLYYSLENPLI